MPGQPCVNHPNEITFVRCGRCDSPICVSCMVDTPVGKKCRACSKTRTHVTESTPKQVVPALLVATVVAVPTAWVVHQIPIMFLSGVIYGAVIAEVVLRVGQRRRSLAMQVSAGVAALIGSLVGGGVLQAVLALIASTGKPTDESVVAAMFSPYPIITMLIGVFVAVSRVRFL